MLHNILYYVGTAGYIVFATIFRNQQIKIHLVAVCNDITSYHARFIHGEFCKIEHLIM